MNNKNKINFFNNFLLDGTHVMFGLFKSILDIRAHVNYNK